MRHILFRIATVLAVAFFVAFLNPLYANETQKPDPIPVQPPAGKTPEALVQLGGGQHYSSYAFVMDKSARTLSIWKQENQQTKFVTAVAADFGRNAGDKSSTGDARTPEGIYFFQQEKENVALDFSPFGQHNVDGFTLDYPNFFDGLEKKSGYGIWLHTLPDNLSLWRGSKGCVVVRQDVLKQLATYITIKKTPIIIQDMVQYITADEAQKRRVAWNNWINTWRDSWQSKNIDNYITHYSDDFKALGMNREQWRSFKASLNEKYSFIKVALSDPMLLTHKNEVVFKLLQDYQSDQNADFGEKTLYIRRAEQDKLAIVGEEWASAPKEGIAAK